MKKLSGTIVLPLKTWESDTLSLVKSEIKYLLTSRFPTNMCFDISFGETLIVKGDMEEEMYQEVIDYLEGETDEIP